MRKSLMIISVTAVFLFETAVYGCTGFCISQGDTVLVGNNEDWKNPKTKVWYEPSSKGKYGRVYFGFDNFYPQGGMNEKGLCFDGFATSRKKVKKSLNKPELRGNNFLDAIMSKCATVEEVLKEFDKYNLDFLDRAMLFFADATGDAAIIEGDEIIRKKGKYQITTNFYQSEVKEEDIMCQRYKIANQMLRDADNVTIDLCKRVLAATHQEGANPTVYSNVYDLKKRVVYLYHFHNFQNVVVIDLAEELKKGKRRTDLPALFPRTYVAEKFQNK
ncbi:MAG: linear amide C-N hydrolase [Phycisphaerales bacterium]